MIKLKKTFDELQVKRTIEFWYKKLEFPRECDQQFYDALDNVNLLAVINYDVNSSNNVDGRLNLLAFLYMCESASKKCLEKKIDEQIIRDTFYDIVIWCKVWSKIKGELYLGETAWLKRHINLKIFTLGRLQFCMNKSDFDIPKYDVKKGDNVIEIHIPVGDKLNLDVCKKSIENAKSFFKKHFPDYHYKIFICHSWLLDDTLNEFLDENSKILLFANLFDKVEKEESYVLFKYIFPYDTTIENIASRTPTSSFSKKIKQAALDGKKFYETLGVLK